MASSFWLKKEDEIIKKMAACGHGSNEIAKVLKSRTPNAIQKRACCLEVSLRQKPEIDLVLFKKLTGEK
jgi:hypothetical protein